MLKRPQVMLDSTTDFVFFHFLCSHSKKQTMTDNLCVSLKQYLLLKILSEGIKMQKPVCTAGCSGVQVREKKLHVLLV